MAEPQIIELPDGRRLRLTGRETPAQLDALKRKLAEKYGRDFPSGQTPPPREPTSEPTSEPSLLDRVLNFGKTVASLSGPGLIYRFATDEQMRGAVLPMLAPTVGGLAGGAVGSLAGPVGSMVGGAAGGAAGEFLNQQLGLTEEDPTQIALAGAIPLAAGGAGMAVQGTLRGFGRLGQYLRGFSRAGQLERRAQAEAARLARDRALVESARQFTDELGAIRTRTQAALDTARQQALTQREQARGFQRLVEQRAGQQLEEARQTLAQAQAAREAAEATARPQVVQELRALPERFRPSPGSQELFRAFEALPEERVVLPAVEQELARLMPEIQAVGGEAARRAAALQQLLAAGPDVPLRAAERELKLLGEFVRSTEAKGGMRRGIAKALDRAFLEDLEESAATGEFPAVAALLKARAAFRQEKGVERLQKAIEGAIRTSKTGQEIANAGKFVDFLRRNQKALGKHFTAADLTEMRTLAERLAQVPKAVQEAILKEAAAEAGLESTRQTVAQAVRAGREQARRLAQQAAQDFRTQQQTLRLTAAEQRAQAQLAKIQRDTAARQAQRAAMPKPPGRMPAGGTLLGLPIQTLAFLFGTRAGRLAIDKALTARVSGQGLGAGAQALRAAATRKDDDE